jgi:hypothetical protein
MVYGFLRALPGDQALLSPSLCGTSAKLDANLEGSGPHDFCRPHIGAFVKAPLASTASRRLTSVTIAKRPFGVGRDGQAYKGDLGVLKTRIFLQMGLDSQITDPIF